MMKTLTFAAVHMSVAFSVVYLTTGNLALGGAVALIEPLCNTIAYFFHEKVWERARIRQTAPTSRRETDVNTSMTQQFAA